jgi:hypothetical protein
MRSILALCIVAICVMLPSLTQAAPDARANSEIRHLLDFVASSGCTFIRNGDPHAAKDAAEHLSMKYERAQSKLHTAEQFIEKVASESYLTGRQYRVQCPGLAEMATADWLRAELAAARVGKGDAGGR